MTALLVSHALAMVFSAALGIMVYWTNPKRTTNQVFLFISMSLVAWAGSLAAGFVSHDVTTVKWCIKTASVAGIMFPLFFNWLRITIKYPHRNLWSIVASAPGWALSSVVVVSACLTDFYIRGVNFPLVGLHAAQPIPEPVYGFFIYFYGAVYLISLIILIYSFIKDLYQSKGVQRIELQFILLGSGLGFVSGLITAVIVPVVTGNSQSAQFASLAVILLNSVVAYGIAIKRILNVTYFLRRMLAYGLLAGYLTIIYLVTRTVVSAMWRYFVGDNDLVPQLLATLAVTFSVAPAHSLMQRFVDRLSLAQGPADIGRALQRANDLLRAITTLDDLLQRFVLIISETMGTDRAIVLTEQGSRFIQTPAPADSVMPMTFDAPSPIIQALAAQNGPLVMDVIQRSRVSGPLAEAVIQMRQREISVAVGIKSKGALEAVLFLGPRLSGRIYTAIEQDALQLLCNQLAVALENAQLYTQVQDGKIYNEILLDNLVNGVIAVNTEGCVTVFNREAQRVTGLRFEEAINRPLTCLPTPLAEPIRHILGHGQRMLNCEIHLPHHHAEVTVRAGGAVFKSHTGKILGALLVFSDITDIKKLESQVRRADRLASIGTLSAGMAHEIKNPLVVLKAFTQMLPERYNDEDFRNTFSHLVHHEVERIDTIVNQLLEFSRPSKPELVRVALHPVIKYSLKLVSEEALKRQIKLENQFAAENDVIMADRQQLQQVLLNFLLNAMDSMAENGRLMVTTTVVEGPYRPTGAEVAPRPYIRLDIADTGCGIAQDALPHIFDPFFTTKSKGTGLGLTVAHGIIREHGGIIDVESRVGQGTVFHIFLPLLTKAAIDTPITT